MKYTINGVVLEMTTEQEAEYLAEQKRMEEEYVPSAEERIAQLETELAELKAIIERGDVNV